MCSFAFVFESKGNERGKLELLLFLFVFVGGRGEREVLRLCGCLGMFFCICDCVLSRGIREGDQGLY